MISDPDVVEFLRTLDEGERINAVSTALRFGLLALRDFGSISKMDWIDKRFQMFEQEIEKRLDDASQELDGYLGKNGELERAFSDADGPIRELLDPNKEGGPISELARSFKEEIHSLRDELVGERARAEEAERGTQKGFKFEDEIIEFLQPLCAKMGDTIRKVGTKQVAGRMVGDIVIEIHEKYMESPSFIILEAKSSSVSAYSDNGLLEQLSNAIELRGAQFGIGIVRKHENLKGIEGSFAYISPDKILCAFDDDGCALELAYRLARTETILRGRGEIHLDRPTLALVSEKISEARKGIKTLSMVKAHITRITNSATEIRTQVESIQLEVSNILTELEGILVSKNL